MSRYASIGVFDSGLGGLSVLREIRALLPAEDLLYVSDSAHVPYGDKSERYIQQRSLTIAHFLRSQGIKALVVACNTATAAAITKLRQELPEVPVIGMEPALKPAVAVSRTGVVGVLATVGTLTSARFAALLARYAGEVRVITQSCPGLVDQIEQGQLDSLLTQALVKRYTEPLLAQDADTLILGCTHYPFLSSLIAKTCGPDVTLIHTGPAVARQLARILNEHQLATPSARVGSERFWTSGELEQQQEAISRLWHRAVPLEPLPPSIASVSATVAGLESHAIE